MIRVDRITSEVGNFSMAMQYKIDKNAHKDNWPERNERGERSWKLLDINFLLDKLTEEHLELLDAIKNNAPLEDILYEAADIGNIAMMIADRLGALPKGNVP